VIARSSTAGARFIVINPSNTALSDPSLRQALSCALDRASLAASLDAVALDSFVLPEAGKWKNPEASPTCSYETFARSAVKALKVAGYRWAREPSERAPGEGLLLPDGSSFPPLTLLAPAREVDAQRASAAHQIELNFAQLGIHLSVKSSSPEDIRYAVFSTGDYDMALLGWQLSDYPAYLCEWFEASGPFAVQDDRLGQACRSMSSTADLDTARQSAYQVQAVLMQDLPFIPLYQVQESEAYRGFSYPFQSTLGGLSDLYGAPGLAIPFP
jgi:ABC-type transport system substrate-binding protein